MDAFFSAVAPWVIHPFTAAIVFPLLIVGVSVVVDIALYREWNREYLVLGKEFALVSLALGFVKCLGWANQYVEADNQAADKAAGKITVISVAPPEGLILGLYLAVIGFSGFMLLGVMAAMGPYMRRKEIAIPTEPVISGQHIAGINLLGLIPLMFAGAILMTF